MGEAMASDKRLSDDEFAGIVRNIKGLCGIPALVESGKTDMVPAWYAHDENGFMAIEMHWSKWLAFAERIEELLEGKGRGTP